MLNDNKASWSSYAPIVMRYGLAAVFLWFGMNQLFNTSNFIGYLPDILFNSGYASSFVVLNAVFEIIAAILLILGRFTRVIAAILGLHLLGIMFDLGYGETLVRDFGIFIGTLGIFLHGPDKWCLDSKYGGGRSHGKRNNE